MLRKRKRPNIKKYFFIIFSKDIQVLFHYLIPQIKNQGAKP